VATGAERVADTIVMVIEIGYCACNEVCVVVVVHGPAEENEIETPKETAAAALAKSGDDERVARRVGDRGAAPCKDQAKDRCCGA